MGSPSRTALHCTTLAVGDHRWQRKRIVSKAGNGREEERRKKERKVLDTGSR